MNKPLRSLSGLIDFDCAARWGSFKLAAQELHKTPAAVSLQIKQLEEALGFALFIRHPRNIALTEKGQELAVSVAKVLGELRTKVAALQGGDEEKILRISTTHSLAIKWLVPRIGRFTKRYPELDIRIESIDRMVNLEDDTVDVAIRYGPIEHSDPAVLFRERLIVIYSPALLSPGQAALTLDDLPRFQLLYENTTETWIQLLRENNALKAKYEFYSSFSNFAVLAQAVIAGQGIGLVSYAIAHDDIRNGTLKMIDCRSAPFHKGYRLLVNRSKEGMPKIARFRDWLQEEMNEMRGTLNALT